MRAHLFSDLHVEFFKNQDYSWFFDGLETDGIDLAILAGDILVARNSHKFLYEFCSHYRNVIHIAGNHEYYGGEFRSIQRSLRNIKIPNYHFLENQTLNLEGKRFHGCTLWYKGDVLFERQMNDFRQIYCKETPFRRFIYGYADISKQFLRANVKQGDIVITHMLPSEACIDTVWKGDPFNCFYFNNCEDVIENNKPAYWFHGHSHLPLDMQIYDTRIIRNPRGYPHENNLKFNKNLIIDL